MFMIILCFIHCAFSISFLPSEKRSFASFAFQLHVVLRFDASLLSQLKKKPKKIHLSVIIAAQLRPECRRPRDLGLGPPWRPLSVAYLADTAPLTCRLLHQELHVCAEVLTCQRGLVRTLTPTAGGLQTSGVASI